ncbi:hypothetical protein [Olivibacter domesticus]|uniref:Lipocalin-like domain-containing protein n=1 Tax=Olivibacter domesticus TaxID=407022 RepID=A0A1H7YYM6_OLID1|nr:hypothetical protein [Olivibacter domesticus]SEM50329.1 hypothetical protein SAMN05661044_05358 [Olivibacter domesticus]
MSKRILLLPIMVLILSACEKTKDPGIEIPKPIDKAIVSTLWNTVTENYLYKNSDGSVAYEQKTVYDEPKKTTIQYKFQEDHRVWRIDKVDHTPSYYGSWELIRENKKDFVVITWGANKIDKYEVTSYTNTIMNWHIVDTKGSDLQYTKDGQVYTASSREGTIELHCPCRD